MKTVKITVLIASLVIASQPILGMTGKGFNVKSVGKSVTESDIERSLPGGAGQKITPTATIKKQLYKPMPAAQAKPQAAQPAASNLSAQTAQKKQQRQAVTMKGGKVQPEPRKVVTHYDVLGVPRTATAQEIQKAWERKVTENALRAKAKGANKAEVAAHGKQLQEAHDALINAKKRAAYDATLPK